jgi:hypothetical protein
MYQWSFLAFSLIAFRLIKKTMTVRVYKKLQHAVQNIAIQVFVTLFFLHETLYRIGCLCAVGFLQKMPLIVNRRKYVNYYGSCSI